MFRMKYLYFYDILKTICQLLENIERICTFFSVKLWRKGSMTDYCSLTIVDKRYFIFFPFFFMFAKLCLIGIRSSRLDLKKTSSKFWIRFCSTFPISYVLLSLCRGNQKKSLNRGIKAILNCFNHVPILKPVSSYDKSSELFVLQKCLTQQ